MKNELEVLVNRELEGLGYDLVEFRTGGSRNRPVLDVRIDRRDGGKVQVGDCERASRAIEARLDSDPALVAGRYVLEVSSPGMERPLRSLADWRRFVGRRATLKSARFAAIGGHVEVEIAKVGDGGADGRAACIVVRDPKGVEHELTLADVQEARLAFQWQPQE